MTWFKQHWPMIWRVAVNLLVALLGFQEPLIWGGPDKEKEDEE